MDNIEEIYKMSKESFNLELERFREFDQKASRYLSALTVFSGLLIYIVKLCLQVFWPLDNSGNILGIVALGGFIFVLFLSWYYAFKALKIQQYRILMLNNKWLKFLFREPQEKVYRGLIKRYAEATSILNGLSDKKSNNIRMSYSLAFCTLVMTIIIAILLVLANIKIS